MPEYYSTMLPEYLEYKIINNKETIEELNLYHDYREYGDKVFCCSTYQRVVRNLVKEMNQLEKE